MLPQLNSLSSTSAATLLLQSLHDSQPASRLQAAAHLLQRLPLRPAAGLQQQALSSQQQELAVLAIRAFAPAALAEAAAAPPQEGSLSLQQLLRQLLDLADAAQAVPAGSPAGSMPPDSIRCAAVQQMGPELFELLDEAAQAQLLLVSIAHLPSAYLSWIHCMHRMVWPTNAWHRLLLGRGLPDTDIFPPKNADVRAEAELWPAGAAEGVLKGPLRGMQAGCEGAAGCSPPAGWLAGTSAAQPGLQRHRLARGGHPCAA